MAEINRILVMKKNEMVNSIFFYIRGQDNYKNVLASAECFASINYEAMIKDPASKGCTCQEFVFGPGDLWAGIRYKQTNEGDKRYFTQFEPIIVKSTS